MESRISYRGLAEIVGMSVVALLVLALAFFEVHYEGKLGETSKILIGALATTILARSVKSAQDRSVASEKTDAGAIVVSKLADEVRGVLQAHGGANQVLLQSLQAVSAVANAVAATPATAPPPPALTEEKK